MNRNTQQEFTQRSDGRWNLWKLTPVKGHSFDTKYNPVWVIAGVFSKLPKWGKKYYAGNA